MHRGEGRVVMEFLLFVITITLFYIAWKIPKNTARLKEEENAASKKASMLAQQLSSLKGRECEFSAGGMAAAFDYGTTGRGTVVDSDAEWVLVRLDTRKGPVERMFRISQLSEVREIKR